MFNEGSSFLIYLVSKKKKKKTIKNNIFLDNGYIPK